MLMWTTTACINHIVIDSIKWIEIIKKSYKQYFHSFAFFLVVVAILLILTIFCIISVLFIADFDLDDEDTCRATVRMFLQCNLVQQFHIPYDVSTQ